MNGSLLISAVSTYIIFLGTAKSQSHSLAVSYDNKSRDLRLWLTIAGHEGITGFKFMYIQKRGHFSFVREDKARKARLKLKTQIK